MKARAALDKSNLYHAFVLLKLPEFREVKSLLSVRLSLKLDKLEEIYRLPKNKLLNAQRNIIGQVKKKLKAILMGFKQMICVDLRYCEFRHLPVSELIEMLGDLIDGALGGGGLSGVVLALLTGILDEICDCGKS